MKLQTPVTDERCSVSISYDDRIMMLGSCFSDNIGRQLADFGFDVCINPFGTLYNPVSILHSIEMLLGEGHFTEEDAVDVGAGSGLVCSFSHHTSFACRDTGEFLAKANAALDKAREYFRSCNKVIITLGTSWCFRHNASGRIVSNCLKKACSRVHQRTSHCRRGSRISRKDNTALRQGRRGKGRICRKTVHIYRQPDPSLQGRCPR